MYRAAAQSPSAHCGEVRSGWRRCVPGRITRAQSRHPAEACERAGRPKNPRYLRFERRPWRRCKAGCYLTSFDAIVEQFFRIPPLRERRDDLKAMIRHRARDRAFQMAPDAVEALAISHHWPQNNSEVWDVVGEVCSAFDDHCETIDLAALMASADTNSRSDAGDCSRTEGVGLLRASPMFLTGKRGASGAGRPGPVGWRSCLPRLRPLSSDASCA